jgi:hypothetical protein
MRSLVQVYALAVCFATLMCLVVALGVGLYDVVQIAAPKFTLAYYEPYRSNATFTRLYPDQGTRPENELTQVREQMLADALHAERRSATQSLVFAAIILAIDVIVFGAHWRIAKRAG